MHCSLFPSLQPAAARQRFQVLSGFPDGLKIVDLNLQALHSSLAKLQNTGFSKTPHLGPFTQRKAREHT